MVGGVGCVCGDFSQNPVRKGAVFRDTRVADGRAR